MIVELTEPEIEALMLLCEAAAISGSVSPDLWSAHKKLVRATANGSSRIDAFMHGPNCPCTNCT